MAKLLDLTFEAVMTVLRKAGVHRDDDDDHRFVQEDESLECLKISYRPGSSGWNPETNQDVPGVVRSAKIALQRHGYEVEEDGGTTLLVRLPSEK